MTLLLGIVFWVFVIWEVIKLVRTLRPTSPVIFERQEENRFAMYERKKYLLDSNAEFALFKVLLDLYGDRFHVFPQVNYSKLVQVKLPERYNKGHRSRFDKKSADFVLCDKMTVVPQLVIELDGPTHAKQDKIDRDGFIDGLMQHVGLPILHIPVGPYTPDSIKKAVDGALAEEVVA